MDEKARNYSLKKHRLAIFTLIYIPFILYLFISSGLVTYVKYLSSVTASEYINLIIFIFIIGFIYYLWMLPLHYYNGFVLEHKFSLSNQTFKDWLKRDIKEGVLSFIIGAPVLLIIYLFLKYEPINWWIWSAALWFFISILLTRLAPILIVPLFYKYSPIKKESLKKRLIELASRYGFTTDSVYEIDMSRDTKKANAALIGIGRGRRIVLADTLMGNFTDEEIESIIAHELGHYKLRHTLKLIIIGGIFTMGIFLLTNTIFLRLHYVFGYDHIYDYESLMIISFIIAILNILILPLSNALSKKIEKDADIFALEATGNVEAFISMMRKLAHQNLADMRPGILYEIILYDHPPISRRITLAESFRQARGIPKKGN